jgi:hypothetical protein
MNQITLALKNAESIRSKNSCGAGIELEQASEPVATLNHVAALFGLIGILREKELVAFALMIGPGSGTGGLRQTESTRQTLLLGGPNRIAD